MYMTRLVYINKNECINVSFEILIPAAAAWVSDK